MESGWVPLLLRQYCPHTRSRGIDFDDKRSSGSGYTRSGALVKPCLRELNASSAAGVQDRDLGFPRSRLVRGLEMLL